MSATTAAASAVDISNIRALTQDVIDASSKPVARYEEETDFDNLVQRVEDAKTKLPLTYQTTIADPFLNYLRTLGKYRFNLTLLQDPQRQSNAGLIMDTFMAICQYADGHLEGASKAFQEVVSDLYKGYISEAGRNGVRAPDQGVTPPLVKWGNPGAGPYTWTIRATSGVLGLRAPIVSLPPQEAVGGLAGWSSLGHETGGHDILHADTGLLDQLRGAVAKKLRENGYGEGWVNYWVRCTDETASDILGGLSMGPAAAIGLVAYFRGLNGGELRTRGSLSGPHPVDILRAYLGAEVVKHLKFDVPLANAWARAIKLEAEQDLRGKTISVVRQGGEIPLDNRQAIQSVKLVARAILETPLPALEGRNLSEVQNWTDTDERICNVLREMLSSEETLPSRVQEGHFAGHVVAAANLEALKDGADISKIFSRMKALLQIMHETNPIWASTRNTTVARRGCREETAQIGRSPINWEVSGEARSDGSWEVRGGISGSFATNALQSDQ